MKRVADSRRRLGVKCISGLIYEESGGIHIVVVVSNISPVLYKVADSRRRRGVKRISGLIYEDGCGIHIVVVVSNVSLVLSMKRVADSRRRRGVKGISGLILSMKRVVVFTSSWWC